MRQTKIIVCNWKAYLGLKRSIEVARRIATWMHKQSNLDYELVIAPEHIALSEVARAIRSSNISLCAQNVDIGGRGAHTGSVTNKTLVEAKCKYVIIGHSDLRYRNIPYVAESNELIAQKLVVCADKGLKPILCIGETLTERLSGNRYKVIRRQLESALKTLEDTKEISELILAYEPVWAISSSKGATSLDVKEVSETFNHIRGYLKGKRAIKCVRLLYGGSVDANNIGAYLETKGVDGLLIGRASTNVKELIKILNMINK